MNFNEDTDAYDPVIAERFELFDRLPTPPLPTADQNNVGPLDDNVVRMTDRWPAYALATAAAVLVVAGLSVAAFTLRDDGQGVAAIDSDTIEAADGLEGDDDVDGATSSTAAGQDSEDSGAAISVAVPADAESEDASESPAEGDGGDSANNGISTTTIADDQAGNGDGERTTTTADDGQTDSTASVPTETTVPPTTVPTTTTQEEPTTSVVPSTAPPSTESEGQVTTISGLLTEVFTDCQSRLVLNDANEVESVGPVSCDGGSHIIVDGRRIQTSAGFVPTDAYYDKHPRNLQPGKNVTVVAVSHANGRLSLDCAQCVVRWG